MNVLRALTAMNGAAALLGVSACGGDDDPLADDGGSGGGDKGSLVISGQDFTESEIMAEMYDQVLSAEGYDVEQKLVDTRDIYFDRSEERRVGKEGRWRGWAEDEEEKEMKWRNN